MGTVIQFPDRKKLQLLELQEELKVQEEEIQMCLDDLQDLNPQAASMIDAAVEAADRFFPAFEFLLQGAKTPDQAMAACMFETVGQA